MGDNTRFGTFATNDFDQSTLSENHVDNCHKVGLAPTQYIYFNYVESFSSQILILVEIWKCCFCYNYLCPPVNFDNINL